MTELPLGGVTFKIEYRRTDEDHGPAIRVFGHVDAGTCPTNNKALCTRFL